MLRMVDLSQRVGRATYKRQLLRHQLALRSLAYRLYLDKRTLVVVVEGWDAAGKSGCIKRLVAKMDPRGYAVHVIAPPTGEAATHHYLWRFWQYLRPPDEKQVLIFERSWYQRVLTERVEGLCSMEAWQRAYHEINAFERQLVDFGIIVVKFWLHISAEEQLRRFRRRARLRHKTWKLTQAHWQRRAHRAQYEEAVEDMLLRTSTVAAPWTVVAGEDKRFARLQVVRTLVEVLRREMNADDLAAYRP